VRILDPGASVDDYARHLCAMYGFHASIEHALAADTALAAAGLAAAQRRNSPWLIQDLRRLDPCSPVHRAVTRSLRAVLSHAGSGSPT
jgi:heme oxygenase